MHEDVSRCASGGGGGAPGCRSPVTASMAWTRPNTNLVWTIEFFYLRASASASRASGPAQRGPAESALVQPHDGAAGHRLPFEHGVRLVGAGPVRERDRSRQGVEPEEITVRVVADRGLRTAPAPLLEAVEMRLAALGYFAGVDAPGTGIDAGDEPVQEGPGRCVRVFAQQGEFRRVVRDAGPGQRRGDVVRVMGVATRDHGVVTECCAAEFDACHAARSTLRGATVRRVRLSPRAVPSSPAPASAARTAPVSCAPASPRWPRRSAVRPPPRSRSAPSPPWSAGE